MRSPMSSCLGFRGEELLQGAVVGGLIVGVLTETLPYYVGAIGGEFQLMPAFVLILVVLLVRPQGLFGTKEMHRV